MNFFASILNFQGGKINVNGAFFDVYYLANYVSLIKAYVAKINASKLFLFFFSQKDGW